jgi:hypothetical protein
MISMFLSPKTSLKTRTIYTRLVTAVTLLARISLREWEEILPRCICGRLHAYSTKLKFAATIDTFHPVPSLNSQVRNLMGQGEFAVVVVVVAAVAKFLIDESRSLCASFFTLVAFSTGG